MCTGAEALIISSAIGAGGKVASAKLQKRPRGFQNLFEPEPPPTFPGLDIGALGRVGATPPFVPEQGEGQRGLLAILRSMNF